MTAVEIRKLQSMLNSVLKPSPRLAIDGVLGPRTRAALHQLQHARETIPSTAAHKLVSASAPPASPPQGHGDADRWMAIAEGELGQTEIAGPAANPRIITYHATTSLAAQSDEVAWCSSFVNWVMKQAGYSGTSSAAAKSWKGWGTGCEPRYGAITVVRHHQAGMDAATGSSSGYHVAFFLNRDAQHISLLGGNQHDMVKISKFPLGSYAIEAVRWPG